MNTLKIFCFTFTVGLIACTSSIDQLNIDTQQDDLKAMQNIPTVSESIVKLVTTSLIKDSNYTIEPIRLDNKVYFWQVNHDKGHYIISSIKGGFPIIKYSDEHFDYNSLSLASREDFYNDLRHIVKSNMIKTKSEATPSLWDDILELFESPENDRNDYDYEIDFSFDSPIDLNEEVISSGITKSPTGQGYIQNRTYKIGYPSTYPLLNLNRRQWSTNAPYNFNMPAPYYKPNSKERVLPLALALTLIMDYHRISNYSFWARQPNNLSQNIESELSLFLHGLCVDIGFQMSTINSYLPEENINNVIPTVLSQKHGLKSTYPMKYNLDQAGFDMLRIHLQKQGPIVYIPEDLTVSPVVIDGIAELLTKVTVKKKFLGITVKKKTKNYYCDYLHIIKPSDRNSDGWKLYDYMGHTKNNVLLLTK